MPHSPSILGIVVHTAWDVIGIPFFGPRALPSQHSVLFAVMLDSLLTRDMSLICIMSYALFAASQITIRVLLALIGNIHYLLGYEYPTTDSSNKRWACAQKYADDTLAHMPFIDSQCTIPIT